MVTLVAKDVVLDCKKYVCRSAFTIFHQLLTLGVNMDSLQCVPVEVFHLVSCMFPLSFLSFYSNHSIYYPCFFP